MEENDEIESEKNLEVADQEETVENTDNEETTETTEGNNPEGKVEEKEQEENETEKSNSDKQSFEDNKYARLARKQAEEKAKQEIEKARKEAYEQGLAQGKVQSYIGRENPYTGQKINDEYDVQEYLDMYELDSKGQDPISGYRQLQKDKARQEAEAKIKAEEEQKQNKWYEDDTKDFVDKYSAEKLKELTKDEDFNLFASGKIGKVPLSNIYEDYQKFISKYEKKSVETAKQILANNTTTPGGVQEAEPHELNWESMSKEQFEKYLEKAKNGELR